MCRKTEIERERQRDRETERQRDRDRACNIRRETGKGRQAGRQAGRKTDLVRSSISTSMASCSTCSSSRISSSCTSSSFKAAERAAVLQFVGLPSDSARGIPMDGANEEVSSQSETTENVRGNNVCVCIAVVTLYLGVQVVGDDLQLTQTHVPHVSSPEVSLHQALAYMGKVGQLRTHTHTQNNKNNRYIKYNYNSIPRVCIVFH